MNFFGLARRSGVQKAHKKYFSIVDCFCNQYPASCRCGEQNASIEVQDKTRQP